jgi:hypothetical protein
MKSFVSSPPGSAANRLELDVEGNGPSVGADRTADAPLRELAFRAGDGVEIALLWSPEADRLVVSVHDTRSGHVFEVPASSDHALDVFYHPYAHAARHGIEYSEPALDPEDSHV